MVVGEPGIGKTSVCEQLAAHAVAQGGLALTGHCSEEGSLSLPYLPFIEVMRSYVLARDPEGLRAGLGSSAADLARIVPEVRDKLGALPEPPAGDPDELRWRLLQAVAAFFRNVSQVQPLLIVLEDLHWADRGSLDLLTHLARNLDGARLLIIGTYRDVEVDRQHPLSGALGELRRGVSFGRVLLRGLGTPEVQQMLQAITGQSVPGSLAETIHRQTEGNPLFVQEVVRYLVEEGMLGQAGQTGSGSVTMSIPEGLRDVIGRRLSRLSPTCNRVLAVAAVIGRDFGLATLLELAGLSEDDLVTALEEATRIGILEDRSRPGVILYRFAHAFFKQMLYEEMIAPRRLRLHQQVAQTLERQYGSRLDEHAAELAEHFAQSTDLADLRKAVRYGELAAAQAMAVYAYSEAVRHLEQAIAVQEVLDPDDTLKRCDLLLALGESLMPAGEPMRVFDRVAEDALALAEAVGDRVRAWSACRAAMLGVMRYGAMASLGGRLGQPWVHRADKYAPPETPERAFADAALAYVAHGESQYGDLRRSRERALRLSAKFPETDSRLLAAHLTALVGGKQDFQTARIEIARSVMPSLTGRENLRLVGSTLSACAFLLLSHGDRAAAEALWQRIADLRVQTQDPTFATACLRIEAVRAMIEGRLEEVPALTQQMIDHAVGSGSLPVGAEVLLRTASLYLGQVPEAIKVLSGLPSTSLQNTLGELIFDAGQGRFDKARAALAEAAATLAPQMECAPITVLAEFLHASLAVGDAGLVERTMPYVERLGTELTHGSSGIHSAMGRLLGAAAALLGEPDKARGYYHQAIEVCTKVRFRPELALTRLQLAELLLDHYPAERAEAIAHLDFAIAECRYMQMAPSLERALRRRELLGE